MPKPLPGYVSQLVREKIREKGYSGLSGLAAVIGVPQMTLNAIFRKSRHKGIAPFRRFCRSLNISADEGAEIMRRAREGEAVAAREIFDQRIPGWTNLPENAYYYSVLKGKGAPRIATIYRPLANALSLSLEELLSDIESISQERSAS